MKRSIYLLGTFAFSTASLVDSVVHHQQQKQSQQPSQQQNYVDTNTHLHTYNIIPVPPTIDVESIDNNSDWYSHHYRKLQHKPHPSYLNQNRRRKLTHATNGTFHNLVLLIRFSDHTERKLPSQVDISRLYNSEEYSILEDSQQTEDDIIPTGSVRQVYSLNSYNKFTIQTTVIDWITVKHSEAYYTNNNHGFSKFKDAIIEALEELDNNYILPDGSIFDYNNFDIDDDNTLDGLGILHSGYGAEFGGVDCYNTQNENRVWSHKGGLSWTSSSSSITSPEPVNVNRYYVSSALRGKCKSNIVRMGVICHEIGHYIGLPDLYDETFEGTGLGAYDFMSQSWGFDGSGKYPPNLSAWSKVQVNWATVITITTNGQYELQDSTSSNVIYKVTHGYPDGEYLLIENRQPIGYDSKIIGSGGIAIYHIDDNVSTGQSTRGYPGIDNNSWPQNGKHYQVSLLSPDGNYDLERGINQGDDTDLWSSSSYSTSATNVLMTELKGGSDQYPNTDTYQEGIVIETGIRIYDFSVSDAVMTFRIDGLPEEVEEEVVAAATIDSSTSSAASMTTLESEYSAPKNDEPASSSSSSPPPTTQRPTSSAPSQRPSKSPVISTPPPSTTQQPTSKSPTLQPTTALRLCTNLCLEAINTSDCPTIPGLLGDCSSVDIGELCDADGECNTEQSLDNCYFYDVYRRVECNGTEDTADNVDTLLGGEADMTNWLTPFEGNDILPDSISDSPSSTPSLPSDSLSSTTTTPPPSSDTLSRDDDDVSCLYYPGWNLGLSYCLQDCHQPSYMQGNPTFEFATIDSCCDLHYQGTSSCAVQSAMHAKSTLGRISGQVWEDVNGNSWQDSSERSMGSGVSDVLIDLYSCSSSNSTTAAATNNLWIKSTRTSLDGSYLFDTLSTPGSYYVQITISPGYHLSTEQSWLIDTEYDSDIDGASGQSACIEFGSDESTDLDVILDAGFIPNPVTTELVSEAAELVASKTADIQEQQQEEEEEHQAPLPVSAGISYSTSSMHSKSTNDRTSDSGMLHSKSGADRTSVSSLTDQQEQAINSGGQHQVPEVMSVVASFLRGSSTAVEFVPVLEDATVHQQKSMALVGRVDELVVGVQLGNTDILLKFDLMSSVADYHAAHKAVLRLYSLTSSPSGGTVHLTSSSNRDWDESSVTWSSAPEAGSVLGVIGKTHSKSWIEVDVTGMLNIDDDRDYATLRISSDKQNHSWVAKYSSKENILDKAPELKLYF